MVRGQFELKHNHPTPGFGLVHSIYILGYLTCSRVCVTHLNRQINILRVKYKFHY